MKSLIFLICLFAGISGAAAQSYRLEGRLSDELLNPVASAGIFLFKVKDSVQVKAVMSDEKGSFQLNGIPAGKYFVRISYIGFTHYFSAALELGEQRKFHNLGHIQLIPDQQVLETVSIKGNKAQIEQSLDRVVLNVENSIMAEGGTALDVLSKAPGLTVSDDGSVSLKGRPGTLVMINGKPTYLSGSQLANLLRGTSSSQISKIEIMANPPAGYDAAGKGGIVNIVMKKSLKAGLNGSISANAGVGRGARLGGGGSLNYRSDKVNVFGNYTYYHQNLKSSGEVNRLFTNRGDNNITGRSVQRDESSARLRSSNFQAGLDYTIDSANTIGFVASGGDGQYPDRQPGSNLLYGADGKLARNATTYIFGKEKWEDRQYNLNYVHKFNGNGHELKADIDYVTHFSRMNQDLRTTYSDASGSNILSKSERRGDLPSDNSIIAGKLDYSLPLAKSLKIDAGWKGSKVKIENILRYDTLANGEFVADLASGNHFKYREEIQAGYISVKKDWGKWSLLAGLRGEYTATEGHQIETDSLVKRDYFQLFPSVFLSREFKENHKLQLGYSRRLERPGYWDLNPFRIYDDPFSYDEGNPYLRPSLVNTVELSHAYRSAWFTTLTYSKSTDVISQLIGGDANLVYQRPENAADFVNYGLSLTGTLNFTSWWSSTQFAHVFRNEFKIDNDKVDFQLNRTSFTFDSQHTFKLGNNWKAELNGIYKSKMSMGVYTMGNYYMISGGFQKSLFSEKCTMKMLVTDIFQSKKTRYETDYGGIQVSGLRRPDSRAAVFSLSYRFGSSEGGRKSNNSGADDLKSRF